MAQRRAPAKQRAPSAALTEDFDFLASQQSSRSDDQAIQVAIAHQLMASREKKRKEHEKRFFQVAKNKLTGEISAAADDVRSTVETTEKAYAKFILGYAALEDTIRALWMEIKKEEQTLIEIAKKTARSERCNTHGDGDDGVRGVRADQGIVSWSFAAWSPLIFRSPCCLL
ncbi:hypothetical protein B0H14DRAFT_358408 [Mycena olivaceomarginata]|nr:hypothetical protein B0H14DRAFT_358408 [Mycena olivaceomarginata]